MNFLITHMHALARAGSTLQHGHSPALWMHSLTTHTLAMAVSTLQCGHSIVLWIHSLTTHTLARAVSTQTCTHTSKGSEHTHTSNSSLTTHTHTLARAGSTLHSGHSLALWMRSLTSMYSCSCLAPVSAVDSSPTISASLLWLAVGQIKPNTYEDQNHQLLTKQYPLKQNKHQAEVCTRVPSL